MTVTFHSDDFEPAFVAAGIDISSVTEHEWRRFENMFLDGTGWSEVAETAAEEIAWERTL
jgi:hypothetical protein